MVGRYVGRAGNDGTRSEPSVYVFITRLEEFREHGVQWFV